MINYLAKLIPDYSDVMAPLHGLLKQGLVLVGDPCSSVLQNEGAYRQPPPVLTYFDVHQPVVLSADASQHGLGAVCLQNNWPSGFCFQGSDRD